MSSNGSSAVELQLKPAHHLDVLQHTHERYVQLLLLLSPQMLELTGDGCDVQCVCVWCWPVHTRCY